MKWLRLLWPWSGRHAAAVKPLLHLRRLGMFLAMLGHGTELYTDY